MDPQGKEHLMDLQLTWKKGHPMAPQVVWEKEHPGDPQFAQEKGHPVDTPSPPGRRSTSWTANASRRKSIPWTPNVPGRRGTPWTANLSRRRSIPWTPNLPGRRGTPWTPPVHLAEGAPWGPPTYLEKGAAHEPPPMPRTRGPPCTLSAPQAAPPSAQHCTPLAFISLLEKKTQTEPKVPLWSPAPPEVSWPGRGVHRGVPPPRLGGARGGGCWRGAPMGRRSLVGARGGRGGPPSAPTCCGGGYGFGGHPRTPPCGCWVGVHAHPCRACGGGGAGGAPACGDTRVQTCAPRCPPLALCVPH
ncbi:collagen alpha-1(III) chain-like [Neopelma chrysocephalum]|uniref:collagen alpha-1(III) chain-like n=1 Tax=Neopelma chrysocephalum TaxID=114329 RepID=UPI000FCCED04|nr:collagen alpha-1(III) chain-like [Neopelma chrysocephalum]